MDATHGQTVTPAAGPCCWRFLWRTAPSGRAARDGLKLDDLHREPEDTIDLNSDGSPQNNDAIVGCYCCFRFSDLSE